MRRDPDEKWTLEDAAETYNIGNWGNGYFSINARGHVAVHPQKEAGGAIDLLELVESIRARGIEPPLLIRFNDIIRHRVAEMHQAFREAIEEFEYQGNYLGVYPIKVNQDRYVVEEILKSGDKLPLGLECGSKPELVAVLALAERPETPIICNGFKDADYIRMVLFAQKIGKTVIPVVEKFSDLKLILDFAEELDVRPVLGVRVKLSARGAGRWRLSGGDRSKFGLTVTELLACLDVLKARGLEDTFRLLHFHLGSQITNIHKIKNAITEVARIYAELRRRCPALEYLDVGGGLGVDYDGSQTNFESSMNYTLHEYARDVIFRVQTVCDEEEVPHPTIVTESGRATIAYHSVLVFNVLGVSSLTPMEVEEELPEELPEDLPQPLHDLLAICREVSKKNLLESYHDAVQAYDELLNAFKLGFLSLEQRSLSERLYYTAAHKILKIVRTLDYIPEELEGLEAQLSDTYFCNFSVFQSLPDSWAVQQLFPIMPLHRLDEEPTRRAILADITCDSDGKVDRFIDLRDVKRTLELHPLNGGEYYLGAFLVGAYQEILGDLHNLFGDTNTVHVTLSDTGEVELDMVVQGDTVREVLSYVHYSARELRDRMRRGVELAVRLGRVNLEECARFLKLYDAALGSYTYLTSASGKRPVFIQSPVSAPKEVPAAPG